jgi:hypothetical protein
MAAAKKRKKTTRRTSHGSGGARGRTAPAGASKFVWRQPQADAALLLAEDELTDREIAAKVGVDPGSIWRWKRHPEFQARVKKHVEDLGECALRHAIGRKNRRLKAINDRWERMQQVIEERAVAPEMQKVPGGKTGLLSHTVKSIGKGDDFERIDLYAVDTGLLAEMRACERQAAQEVANWVEKVAPTNPDGTDEYSAGGFTPDEVLAILGGLAARLGLAADGPDREEPEDPAG